jgi:hypothetical protein
MEIDLGLDSDFSKLGEEVNQHDGVLTVPMWRLRDNYGAGKLGIHVRAGISQALHSAGLDHYPVKETDGHPLPGDQSAMVRIYRQGTPVADLIDAVLHPGPGHDDELRQLVGGNTAEQTLKRVRELVCP